MIELSAWLWESIYTVKQMYDHDCAEQILSAYGNDEIDGDMMYEIASDGIGQVFSDTRGYYNQSDEVETIVFFDPIITDFYQLCAEYERKKSIPSQQNPYRVDMERAINSGFAFHDYSYSHEIYSAPNGHSGYKLVLLFSPEFCCHYQVPSGLLDIRDAFVGGTERLRQELEEMGQSRVIELPILENTEERRAA